MSEILDQAQRPKYPAKSEVSITMHDLLNAPIQQLKYEVRRGSTILAKGFTCSEGKLAKVQGKIGDEIAVHVARIENTEEMKLIKTFQLTSPLMILPLISGKVLFHFNVIKHEGEKGTYKKSTYTVKSGDTLSKIAHAHNTTVDDLARVNHINHSDINNLDVGQVLTLPAPSASQDHAASTPAHHHHRHHSRHHHHPAHAPLQQQRSASTGNPTAVVPPIAGQENVLTLSKQDIDDIVRVTATEVVPSLKGDHFTKQAGGVVDTILNRRMSGLSNWDTIRKVINERGAFSDINSNQSTAYGSVQNVPDSRVTKELRDAVIEHLKARETGAPSLVGNNLNYANTDYVLAHPDKSSKATLAWVKDIHEQAAKSGYRYGAGKAFHDHGTMKDSMQYRPDPFTIKLEDKV